MSEIKLKRHEFEALLHFRFGPIWDGNLISKSARDHLCDLGLVERSRGGFQFLTRQGVELLYDLHLLSESTWSMAPVTPENARKMSTMPVPKELSHE